MLSVKQALWVAPQMPQFVCRGITSHFMLGISIGNLAIAATRSMPGRRPKLLICAPERAPACRGLVIGRFVLGIGIGISAVVVPTYLGEVAPARLRGRMVELYEVMLCAGMLGALLADVALMHVPGNWRWMVGMPFFPSAITACELGCRLPGAACQQRGHVPCCLPGGCCSS